MGSSTEVQKLVRKLRRQGFDVQLTKKGHFRVKRDGHLLFMPSTPSDNRSMKNMMASLKRAGYDDGSNH